MPVVDRIVREPAALTGLITATLGVGFIFEWWALTSVQEGAVLAVVGAVILFLRAYLTPVYDPNLPIGTVVNANSGQPTGVVVAED